MRRFLFVCGWALFVARPPLFERVGRHDEIEFFGTEVFAVARHQPQAMADGERRLDGIGQFQAGIAPLPV
ncbi:MAG: hypothetical protein LBR88_10890 [Zoogloeaceae bacterium]|jgi:hypothetical protein|nr:hypothetical protein [Zoogloeaceae bacterium]